MEDYKMAKLHVGIIGCGSISQQRHIPEYVANPNVEIIGYFDRNKERAQQMTETHGGHLFKSVDELLDDSTIEAVSVCVANAQHAPITIQALQRGKHVLCEKPMAVTMDECKAMILAAKENGKRLMIDQNQRFALGHQKAKKLISSKLIGKVLSFKTTFGHGGPETWSVDSTTNTWFFDKKSSKYGAIFDLGIHKIDLIHYLLKERITETYAKLTTLDKRDSQDNLISVDDNAMAILTTETGVIGTLSASWTYYGEENNSTIIYGTEGIMKIYSDPQYSIKVALKNGEKINYQLDQIQTNDDQTSSGIIDEFVTSIIDNRESLIDGESVLNSMKTVFACIASSEKGTAVSIN
jgi:predicted dehydrogenase